MKKILVTVAVILSFVSVKAFACDCEKDTATTFDHLKSLVGTWEGTTTESGKEEKATMTYELTSGGTALVETLFPGTPHEMVSVYHTNKKDIKMTHYCMLGNQPKLSLKKAEGNKMFFELQGSDGLQSKKEEHMHSLEVVWNNDNEITQNWTDFKDGKTAHTSTFNWKRAVAKK